MQRFVIQRRNAGRVIHSAMHALRLQQTGSLDRFMQDTGRSKVLVFTSLEDLGKLSTSPIGRRLLECFEEWKGLPNENRNICIFLSDLPKI